MRIAKQNLIVGVGQQIPTSICCAVITECKAGTTNNGDPKWVITYLVYAPETTEFDGRPVALAGTTGTLHQNINPSSKGGASVLFEKLEVSGFDFTKFNPEGELDTDMPGALVGHAFSIAVSSRQKLVQKTQTEAEKAEGKKREYLLGADGKPISLGYEIDAGIGLQNVVGPATVPPPMIQF